MFEQSKNWKKINEIPKGGYFKIGNAIYIRGDYDRSSRKYQVNSINDVWGTGRLLKPTTKVRTDFEY